MPFAAPVGYVDNAMMPTAPLSYAADAAFYMPSDPTMAFAAPVGYMDASGNVVSLAAAPMGYAAVPSSYMAPSQASPFASAGFYENARGNAFQSGQSLSGASMADSANVAPFTPSEPAQRLQTPVPQRTLKPLKKGDSFVPKRPLPVAPKPLRSGAMPSIAVASKGSASQNPFTEKASAPN